MKGYQDEWAGLIALQNEAMDKREKQAKHNDKVKKRAYREMLNGEIENKKVQAKLADDKKRLDY